MTPGGGRNGPLPESQLKVMVARDQISDMVIWREGLPEWLPLAEFPQLLPGYEDPSRKRKREPTHVMTTETRGWLSNLDEETLISCWIMACDLDELLVGQHSIRDRLLMSYIERDPDLEGDSEDFLLSDEFFRDVLDIQGPRQTWKMLYPGNEQAMLDLLFHAAKYDRDIYERIRTSHSMLQIKAAVVENDAVAIMAIVTKNPSVLNCVDSKGKSPLHVAVEASKPDIVKALLDFTPADEEAGGADVNDADDGGNTALHLAAESGNVEMARDQLPQPSSRDSNLFPLFGGAANPRVVAVPFREGERRRGDGVAVNCFPTKCPVVNLCPHLFLCVYRPGCSSTTGRTPTCRTMPGSTEPATGRSGLREAASSGR
mmetsp:Transcript_6252/g.17486  ORF Transcript_6252/g.17486 Transcript_6252/m.17486 type:complete len:373 (-) Transcript_6252:936-2054(-)